MLRVEPHGGNWVVRDNDLDPPLGTFPTKHEAEERARQLALAAGPAVVVDDERQWEPEQATKQEK